MRLLRDERSSAPAVVPVDSAVRDDDLVVALRPQDSHAQAAFAQRYDRYSAAVYGLALRLLGVDGLAGQNVLAIVLQAPVAQVTADGQSVSGLGASNAVIGSWTTASRQKTKVLGPGTSDASGDWVHVSRLGNPLVNEAVIPLAIQDAFNTLYGIYARSHDPSRDGSRYAGW